MRRRRGMVWVVAAVGFALSVADTPAPTKVLDRKFPVGLYCPAESRATAGVDLSFVAPASTISITFSGMNRTATNLWNGFHVDNVSVTLKSIFDTHLLTPTPGFESCYIDSIPPGQTTPGDPNVPAYDFNSAGSTEVFLDLFDSGITGWTGQHLYSDPNILAPTIPANNQGLTGRSLGLGLETDGQVPVNASRTITGLTAGQQYVLFFWWYAKETSPLTIIIGVPCADVDGDGFVVCGACDPLPTQTCGECNDANAHCGANCADQDADGWCVTTDCDDGAASCTDNCAADTDTDAVADCRDGCLDPDRDGYGSAGGAPNTCLGPDCNATNPWCNTSCVDADADGHCVPGDCQDNNASVANGLAEVNDAVDQNCPGDEGYGVIDEISGISGFVSTASLAPFTWTAQTGATSYLAVRSVSPAFPSGCASSTLPGTSWADPALPLPNNIFYYLVRPLLATKGSYGQRSNGVERATVCGIETDCDNGADDDLDAAADCADADCAGTALCKVATFTFLDSTADDIADNAFAQFLQTVTTGSGDYIFFEIQEPAGRTVSWCSENAGFYKTQYLALAPTQGSATSGSWNKWRKAPQTGNAWVGPTTTGNLNTYGDQCFGFYTWCSEQFSTEPQNCLFPNRTNNCEVYDNASGACGASIGGTWRLTIKIASTRFLACGF